MGLLATIRRNGGATLNADTLTDAALSDGYAVGVATGTALILPDDADDTTLGVALRLIAGAYECSFVGAWVADDGVHLDPVEVAPNLADAMVAGRRYNQRAVYDLARGEEVAVA
jgi:hypothetical protein